MEGRRRLLQLVQGKAVEGPRIAWCRLEEKEGMGKDRRLELGLGRVGAKSQEEVSGQVCLQMPASPRLQGAAGENSHVLHVH